MTEPPDSGAVELAHRLFDFARAGDTAQIGGFLDAGAPVALTDAAGNTLVMLAAYHGHAETVAALIDRGADVNSLNDHGQSPLAGALFKGEEDVVALLVRAGADPDIGSPTAREAAMMFGVTHLLD